MKILDPGSVVREGEFATAQNATGVPEQIRNKYNQIKEGERLGAKQRQDFLDQARNAYDAEQVNQRQLDVKYTEIAKTYGFDPSRVLLPFEAQDPNASDPKIAAYAKQFKLTYQQAEVILRKRGYVSKPE